MTAFEMYVILKLDSAIAFFGNISEFSLFALIITLVAYVLALYNCKEGNEGVVRAVCKPFYIVFFSCAIVFYALSAFIPSTKEMAAIYVLPCVVNNGQVRELPSKVVEVITKTLDLSDEWLDELKPGK